MNPIAMFIGLVLLAASVFYIASPFRTTTPQRKSAGRRDALKGTVKVSPEKQREAVLLALRDLDFDYQAGKVAEEDYQSLRTHLLMEAAQLMERQELEKDDSIEALIQSRKQAHSTALPVSKGKSNGICHHCQAPLAEGAKFCSKCGSPVKGAVCPKCHQTLLPGDHFCPVCGTAAVPEKAAEAEGE